jgi:hypothetical protein
MSNLLDPVGVVGRLRRETQYLTTQEGTRQQYKNIPSHICFETEAEIDYCVHRQVWKPESGVWSMVR